MGQHSWKAPPKFAIASPTSPAIPSDYLYPGWHDYNTAYPPANQRQSILLSCRQIEGRKFCPPRVEKETADYPPPNTYSAI
ncbi:unnamed protein product [Clavelina lepadiformis]|uniref:Uncharacterized protein n=1 Tax=Clavelina lepadiformis TaxID=159417 RepID=A0ABP0GFB8_CLALP